MARRTRATPIVVAGSAVGFTMAMTVVEAGAFPRVIAKTTLVSQSAPGVHANDTSSVGAISDDGAFVAFRSVAGNLVTPDTNGTADVFVRDLVGNRIGRVSVTEVRSQSNGGSYRSAITGDGAQLAFDSGATNLVSNDLNGEVDVFATPVVYAPTPDVTEETP